MSHEGRQIDSLLKREEIFAGQAPETFVFGKYYEANRVLVESGEIEKIKGSTEPAIMAGMKIHMIPGDEKNFKITTQEDLDRFVEMVKKYAGRLGSVKMDDTEFVDTVGCFATALPEAPQEGEKQRVYCTFGNGNVDKVGAYQALKDAGYDEWIVMESKEAFNVEKTMMKMQAFRKKYFK